MPTSGGIRLLSVLCIILAISAALAKKHHESRSETRQSNDGQVEEAPSGYCSKTDRKTWSNGWANTTMDIQYTKTVKIETSRESKLKEGTRKIHERYRRNAAVKETPADKKKRKRKNKKARKDKKQKQQTQAKTETSTPQGQKLLRKRSNPFEKI